MDRMNPLTSAGETTWVDAAIGRTNPVADSEPQDWDLAAGYQSLLERIVATDPRVDEVPLRHRRVSRRASGLAVVAVLVVGAGAAAAVGSGALTGVFGTPGSTETDTSEFVNRLSPAFPPLERQLFQELLSDGLRFPPRINTNVVIDSVVNQAAAGIKKIEEGSSSMDKSLRTRGLEVQVTGIKGTFAGVAQCSWEGYWVDAYKAGNQAHEDRAVQGMAALNNVITTTPTKNGTHRGSITAETNRKKALIQDVRLMKQGDVKFFQRDISINCANSGT
jgi:hypothetical protein